MVATTLETLAQGDRMVGVVTHVTALAERVPVRFRVATERPDLDRHPRGLRAAERRPWHDQRCRGPPVAGTGPGAAARRCASASTAGTRPTAPASSSKEQLGGVHRHGRRSTWSCPPAGGGRSTPTADRPAARRAAVRRRRAPHRGPRLDRRASATAERLGRGDASATAALCASYAAGRGVLLRPQARTWWRPSCAAACSPSRRTRATSAPGPAGYQAHHVDSRARPACPLMARAVPGAAAPAGRGRGDRRGRRPRRRRCARPRRVPRRTSDLLIVDGPLRGRQHLPRALGYIKSHRSTYLPPELNALVGTLAPGQRTPVFLMGTSWDRHSWYLRPAGPPGAPWAGVVRVECAADLPVAEVTRLAGLSQAASAGSPPPRTRTPAPRRTCTRSPASSASCAAASATRGCSTGRSARPPTPQPTLRSQSHTATTTYVLLVLPIAYAPWETSREAVGSRHRARVADLGAGGEAESALRSGTDQADPGRLAPLPGTVVNDVPPDRAFLR